MPRVYLGRAGRADERLFTGMFLRNLPPSASAALPLATLAALASVVGFAYHFSAVGVTLNIDGVAEPRRTRAATVGDLLLEAGVPVAAGDWVRPAPAARLERGGVVEVNHVRAVRVVADGRTQLIRSLGHSPLAVLLDAGLTLGQGDAVAVDGRRWPVEARLPAAGVAAEASAGGGAEAQGWSPFVSLARAQELSPPDPGPAPSESARPDPAEGAVLPPEDQAALASANPPAGAGNGLAANSPAGLGQPAGAAPRSDTTSSAATSVRNSPVTDTLTIAVLRAVPVVVLDDGTPLTLAVAGASVAEALAGAGLGLLEGDDVSPMASAPLVEGMQIVVSRAVSFSLTDGEAGEPRTVRARADTVGQALARLGSALLGRDYAIPPAETRLTPGLNVEVVRVREDVLVEEVPIAYGRDLQADAEMELDSTRVIKAGEPGLKRQKVRITYANGEEESREVIASEVLREPVSEQLAYGTNIVWRTVDTPEGPLRYWRKLRMYATSYSASRSGTSPDKPWYGHTRIGLPMRRGIIAVNEKVLFLGTQLYVPGYGVGLAGDTGRLGVYHVDLGFDDDNYESWHWKVDVYCVEPLPPEIHIRYILPDGPVSPFFYGR